MKLQSSFIFFVLILLLLSSISFASALLPPPPPKEHFIYTEDDLKKMTYETGDNVFYLMNDIEIFSSHWNPIGTAKTPFKDQFQGNNHTITFKTAVTFIHCEIEEIYDDWIMIYPTGTVDDGHGFFGNVEYARIYNLNLVFPREVMSVFHDDSDSAAGNNTGSLVGVAGPNTVIENCSVKSQGHSISGRNNVGGLVGSLSKENANDQCYIINSSSDFSVKAEQDNAGGLVGIAFNNSYIRNSSASGSVEAQGKNAGGIVGSFYHGNISNSSATGSVKAEENAGGLIGYIFHSTFYYGNPFVFIENSFASGSIDPSGIYGRFIGGWDEEFKPTVTNSFYRNHEVNLTYFPDENWVYPDDDNWEGEITPPPKKGEGGPIIFGIVVVATLIILLAVIVVHFRKNNK
jgi:hypothetical protein